ncbi:MAG: DUF1905 domain-containing protein [Armatimonadetes bacterium]|nr:DUF1905 domain-containing protein [Armatimonadota bacterium]
MPSFKSTLAGTAEGPTGIVVPPEIIDELGQGKKPPVALTVNGYAYRSTVAVMGGAFMIPFSSEHRVKSGIKAGDAIEVVIEFDDKPREVEVPEALAAALEASGLREKFDKQAPSKRKEFVRQVNDAKAEDTRQRRIDKIVADLQS